MEMDAKDAPTWDSAECADAWESGYNSALSHPEPGAQETVAWLGGENERICDATAMRQWEASLKRPDLTDRDRVRGALEAFKRQAIACQMLAHPSPPPEQGEDDLVQRLRAATMRTDWNNLPDDACIPAIPLLREAATTISTLRARVAELEARATPQAPGNAEPVAGLCPRCAGSGQEPNARELQCSKCMGTGAVVIATPSDSDAVRALREALEKARYVPGDYPVVPVKIAAFMQEAQRILSNQGSSSND